ncbi:MAG TPA: haloacid dehalogenase [Dehalococcoidia bacterium]|nr:haloacid dehalogenase [Dehalococcoidia bacterium]
MRTEHSQRDLDALFGQIRESLESAHRAREQALRLSREVVQHAANAIRAVHRGDAAVAEASLHAAASLLQQIAASLERHPEFRHAGYVQDALKEFAEAQATAALVRGEPLPSPEALGVNASAYLNGLGEAAQELRRYILDAIRHGDLARCEELLDRMEDIYTGLMAFDFPDAITGGLKRTTDMLRGVLERTRGDLTMALRQHALEQRLAKLEES